MDNVKFHHCEEIKGFLSMHNASTVYLPPYSPDLNPIENFFPVVKSKMDSVRPRSRSKEELKENPRTIMNALFQNHLAQYYRSFWERVNQINNRMIE